jgi:bacterial/archaeal transporter family-2 protein
MQIGWLVLAGCSGMLLPFQAAANARLARELGTPVHAAAVNFVVGLVALTLVAVALAGKFNGLPKAGTLPWWAWTGGLFGATMVAIAAGVGPKIGVLALTGGLLAGQLLASMIVDHFGLFGLAAREISPARLGGVALVVLGVVVIRWA